MSISLGADMVSPDPSAPEPRPVRPAPLLGPTTSSSVLVGGTCLVGLLDAWTAWYRHGVAADYVAGVPGMWVADLTSADSTARTVDVLYVLAITSAAIALLVWASRVRANARLLGRAGHPPRRAPVLGAWFAVCLVAVTTTLLPDADPSVAELSTLATVDSVVAVVLCLAGAAVVVVVRRTARRAAAGVIRPA